MNIYKQWKVSYITQHITISLVFLLLNAFISSNITLDTFVFFLLFTLYTSYSYTIVKATSGRFKSFFAGGCRYRSMLFNSLTCSVSFLCKLMFPHWSQHILFAMMIKFRQLIPWWHAGTLLQCHLQKNWWLCNGGILGLIVYASSIISTY